MDGATSGIRTHVYLIDIQMANHLVQTVQASRLMGATVIVTGISGEISQTLVRIGIDLNDLSTAGDLQSGLEQAERLLGDVNRTADGSSTLGE